MLVFYTRVAFWPPILSCMRLSETSSLLRASTTVGFVSLLSARLSLALSVLMQFCSVAISLLSRSSFICVSPWLLSDLDSVCMLSHSCVVV